MVWKVPRLEIRTGKGKKIDEVPEANPPGLVARVRIVSLVQYLAFKSDRC